MSTFQAEVADPFRKVTIQSTEIDYIAEPVKKEATSNLLLHKDAKPWTVLSFDVSSIKRRSTEGQGKSITIKEFIEALVRQGKTRFQDRSVKLVYDGEEAKKAIIESIKDGTINEIKNVVKPTILNRDIMNLAPDLSVDIKDEEVTGMADLKSKVAEAQAQAQEDLKVDIKTEEVKVTTPKKRGRPSKKNKQTT